MAFIQQGTLLNQAVKKFKLNQDERQEVAKILLETRFPRRKRLIRRAYIHWQQALDYVYKNTAT